MNWRNREFLNLVRGQPCYLDVPGVCKNERQTVVPCHSNLSRHGHGMGVKAHDAFVVPGCLRCHVWLDQGYADKQDKQWVWQTAWEAWILHLLVSGAISLSNPPENRSSGSIEPPSTIPTNQPRTKVSLRTGKRVVRDSRTAKPSKMLSRRINLVDP